MGVRTCCGSSSVHEEYKEERKEIMALIVNEMDELGEMALFTSAERGHIEVVKKLFPYTTEEKLCLKNRSGFDPFHIAARKGHKGCPTTQLATAKLKYA
ncbi:ankyrin repeat-containing protein ITN1-like protein [Tanacetum coccineum]